MKKLIFLALLMPLLLATGCESEQTSAEIGNETEQNVKVPEPAGRHKIGLSGSAIGDYVSVGDNKVPCVFFENVDGGGVDCGWEYMEKAK